VEDTIRAIKDYVFSDRNIIEKDGTHHPIGYGDIAVICRKTEHCRLLRDACEENGIPAYLQGDVRIMSTREGKLALAWLRYVNNDRDPWAYVTIMADLGYTPVEIRSVCDSKGVNVPESIKAQRESLYRKRRRITDLLTCLFQYYGLDNDITQAIITTMSTMHRGSLLTVSDVIRVIEEDIANGSEYPVENFIDNKAVTIMTMHKSKGLEFPVVITPFIDSGTVPVIERGGKTFTFDNLLGIRCSKEVGHFGGYSKICTSWRTRLARTARAIDYSEERRLMFVAMSRAKQFVTIICGPKPSRFIEAIKTSDFERIPEVEYDPSRFSEELLDVPAIPEYPARRSRIGVHDLLRFEDEEGGIGSADSDEVGGKGMEYGTMIHKIAESMCNGNPVDDTYPEVEEIRKVLDRVKDADICYPEIECGLPFNDLNATVRGIIDLLVLYPDRIEIHDYKTDVSDRFESEYEVQLSIYSYAVEGFYNKPVRLFIDYVSRKTTKEVERVPMAEIRRRVERAISDIINDTGN